MKFDSKAAYLAKLEQRRKKKEGNLEEKSTEDSIDDFVPLPPPNGFEGSKAAQELL